METVESQERVLAYLVQNKGAIGQVSQYLKVETFSEARLQSMYRLLLLCRTRLKCIPTRAEMRSLLYGANPTELDFVRKAWAEEVDRLYDNEVTAATWRELCTFILRSTVPTVLDGLHENPPEDILANMRKVADSLTPLFTLGSAVQEAENFFCEEYLQRQAKEMDEMVTEERIPLGWGSVDRATGGGMLRGEVVLFLASSGTGKSMFVTNILYNQLEIGLRCLHLDFDNVEAEMRRRMYSRVTGISMNDQTSIREQHKQLRAWREHFGIQDDAYRYKELLPNNLTISGLRGLILAMDERYGAFDCVFIDYGEQILPDKGAYDADRLKIASVFEGFRSIAKEFKKVFIAPTQANRNKFFAKDKEKGYTSAEGDIGEAYAKLFPCQLMMTFDQKKEEKLLEPPAARVNITKNRHGQSGLTLPFTADFAKAYLGPDPEARAIGLMHEAPAPERMPIPKKVVFNNTRYRIDKIEEPRKVVD